MNIPFKIIKARLLLLFAFIKVLSIYRLLNLFFLIISYAFSLLLRRPLVWSKPISLAIETSSQCNLKCIGCDKGLNLLYRRKFLVSFDEFKKIIDTIPNTIFHLTLHGQGEPLMNLSLHKMIAYANQKNIIITFSTNGLLLDEQRCVEIIQSGLTYIVFSLDGYDQTSYEQFRTGGLFQKLLDNILMINNLRKKFNKRNPIIIVQTIVTNKNEKHLRAIKNIAFKCGTDLFKIKTAFVNNLNSLWHYLPEDVKFRRYIINSDGTLKLKGKPAIGCFRIHRSLTITSDGLVIPCCYDKNATFVLGSIYDDSFEALWHGHKLSKLRERIFSGDKPHICLNCIEAKIFH